MHSSPLVDAIDKEGQGIYADENKYDYLSAHIIAKFI